MSRKPSLLKKLKWRVEYVAYLTMERILGCVSTPLLWRIGARISFVARLFGSRWPAVRNNVRTLLGAEASKEEVEEFTKEVFRHTTANLLTSLKCAHLPLDDLQEVLTVENLELVHGELEKGKGLLILVAHMGNWEVLAQSMPLLKSERKSGNLYRPLNNIYLNEVICDRRRKKGMELFAKSSSVHAPMTLLREGNIMSILCDQRAGRFGTLTPFFGRLMAMTPLPELMQRRTGCSVVGSSLKTTAPGRWTLKFHELTLPEGEKFQTPHMAELLEHMIEESPADEFWMQNLWRVHKKLPLHLPCKKGPIRLTRRKNEPLYPFGVLLRISDEPEHFEDYLPALRALAASRPDMQIHVMAGKTIEPLTQQSDLPLHYHGIEKGELFEPLPPHLQVAIVLSNDELLAQEVSVCYDGPSYGFSHVLPSGKNWGAISCEDSPSPPEKWLAALRSLGMHDPPLTWTEV